MTQKLEQLIAETAAQIIREVDDCLIITSKRKRTVKLLTDFADKLEKDGELTATTPPPANAG